MRKSRMIIILIIFTISLIFSSCSTNNTKDNNNKGQVTLTFATFLEEGAQADAYKDIITEFESNNPDIKVVLESGAAGYNEKIKNSLESGKGPDIIGLSRVNMMEYVKQDKLMDLTDWVESSNFRDKYYGVSTGYGKLDNKYYGIGDLPYTIEWFYNPGLFKRAGVTEPKTLDDLINVCGKLKNYIKTPIAVGAKDPWNINTFFGLITGQTMDTGRLSEALLSRDKAGYSNLSGGQEAVDILYRLVKTGSIPTSQSSCSYSDSVDEFVKGRAAILPMGSWATLKIDAAKPKSFSYNVFKNPVKLNADPKSTVSATAIQVITVNKNTAHLKEVMRFMDFLFSQEAQTIFAEKNSISGLKTANTYGDDDVKTMILKHLELTDENSTMFIDNVSDKMLDTAANKLNLLVGGKLMPDNLWETIVNESF